MRWSRGRLNILVASIVFVAHTMAIAFYIIDIIKTDGVLHMFDQNLAKYVEISYGKNVTACSKVSLKGIDWFSDG